MSEPGQRPADAETEDPGQCIDQLLVDTTPDQNEFQKGSHAYKALVSHRAAETYR